MPNRWLFALERKTRHCRSRKTKVLNYIHFAYDMREETTLFFKILASELLKMSSKFIIKNGCLVGG